MGLTKQYLRYVPAGTFNVIANSQCNNALVTLENQEGRFVAVGASEHVFIWDMRRSEKAQVLSGENVAVVYMCSSPNKKDLAVGYSDGVLKIFDLPSGDIVNIFSGHRNQITAITFDVEGHKVATGAQDNEIILWDVVADCGICRLSGHKGPITEILFLSEQNILISASKDTFIKFWDIENKYCFKTLTGHKTEIWGAALVKQNQYLITGCGDSELRVWKLSNKETDIKDVQFSIEDTQDENFSENKYNLECSYVGSILRNGKGRVMNLKSDLSGQIVACHGTDTQIELFMICSDELANQRLKKRQKKERQKAAKSTVNEEIEIKVEKECTLSLRDEVRRLSSIKLDEKPRSIDLIVGNGGEIRISAVLVKNNVVLYSLQSTEKAESKLLRHIAQHGHHSEIRALDFSSDNLAIISGSADSVKVWNKSSQACLRTIKTDYILSLCFVPGDRHALAGLKDGRLLILDISVGDILEEIPAHEKELWSIGVTPNMRGCVTGGGDSTVKFWNFELVVDGKSENKAKVLSLLHTRTLQLEENVLCVKISPNNKFIAVSLLDSTVKIFFCDSLKFYLSLYGHKLPVLCMDISSDSNIIATGSADRNVKIWGLDFGDCHKSLFAHNDSVTGLRFVPKTHYFFTTGRDGKIKQWDADSYDKIITLPGHIGEAWSLAISPNGKHVLTSGSDYTLRLWECSEETLVLEDIEEDENEASEQLATGEETVVPGKGTVQLATKKTVGSEKAAELILECLEVSEEFDSLSEGGNDLKSKNIPIPPLMQAFQVDNTDDYVLEIFKRIRSSDLEEALLLLPFTNVCQLLEYLPRLAARGDQIELINRIVILLLQVHSSAIKSSPKLLLSLKALEKYAFLSVEKFRDTVGFNLHSLLFLKREVEESEGIQLFRNATNEVKDKTKKNKQKQRRKRLLIAVV